MNKRNILYYAAIAGLVVLIIGLIIFVPKGRHEEDAQSDKPEFNWETVDVEYVDTNTPFVKEKVTLSGETIAAEIRELGQLVTAEYHYRHAESYEDVKNLLGLDLGFTKTSFICMIDGDIYAGIDLNSVDVQVDEAQKIINITLPKSQVTSHELDHDSYEVVEEKEGAFNSLSSSDVNRVFAAVKEKEETRAVENGILERADDNAEHMIKVMLTYGMDLSGYTLKFDHQ